MYIIRKNLYWLALIIINKCLHLIITILTFLEKTNRNNITFEYLIKYIKHRPKRIILFHGYKKSAFVLLNTLHWIGK